ncbi:MAG: SAM-dependent methyltransferase, partial [Sphingomonas bacterium]|nr:SAM-dependent methyltransferase [Sphingomonas bacterium]
MNTPPPDLFDRRLRALRRDRAARTGPELFLNERAFAECLDRLGDIKRRFTHALLIGVPDPGWIDRLGAIADRVDGLDPG